jgi:hypothetical protein
VLRMSRKGLMLLHVFLSESTQGRGWVCLGFLELLCDNSCMVFMGILNSVWNVFCFKKSTCCFMGALKVFGIEGKLGNNDVWTGWFYLEFLFNL